MNANQVQKLETLERTMRHSQPGHCIKCGAKTEGTLHCDNCWAQEQLAELSGLYPGCEVCLDVYTWQDQQELVREGWFLVRRYNKRSAWIRGYGAA